MGSAEIYLIVGIIAGFAYLFGRDRMRLRRQLERAERRGLQPGHEGLTGLPASLQSSVLFVVGDGGHERNVSVGELEIEPRDDDADHAPDDATLSLTVFDFTFQRDVRGEWGFLDSEPRFRIFSPLTVIAFEFPQASIPHLVIKRRGPSEKIAEDGWERYKSVADVVRDMSSVERAMAVEPPGDLPRRPMEPPMPMPDHLVWAAHPESARAILARELLECLATPRATSRELIVEVLDSLMLVYCAKDGALDGEDMDAFMDTAQTIARIVWRHLPAR